MCKCNCDPMARYYGTTIRLERPQGQGQWWVIIIWNGHQLYQGGYETYDAALAQLQPDALAALMVEHVNAEEAAEVERELALAESDG